PNGAGVHASPMISVVTPCVTLDRHRGSRISGRIEWLRMSMKPGLTTMPEASTTSPARPVETLPAGSTSRIRSPEIMPSPRNHGLPVPSTTLAPRINVSMVKSLIPDPPLPQTNGSSLHDDQLGVCALDRFGRELLRTAPGRVP